MYQLISFRVATYGILFILSIFVVLHLLILTQIIPFDMVWGGRLKSTSEMVSFELISITSNVIMLVVVAAFTGVINLNTNRRLLRIVLWIMFVVFLLNTVGNLLSTNMIEKLLFTPLTILLSIYILRLVVSDQVEGPLNQIR